MYIYIINLFVFIVCLRKMSLEFIVEPQIGHWVAEIPTETLQQLVDSSNLRPEVEVFDIENNRAVITRVT